MLGIIRRTFTFLNKITLLYLSKALIRPHLEYGNKILWFPLLKRQLAEDRLSLSRGIAIDRYISKKFKVVP